MTKSKLIMVRHGESEWNKLNRFTGWVDIPLSKKGIDESFAAGKKIAPYEIDIIFTSALVRAEMTALIAMIDHPSKKVPVILHLKEENTSKETLFEDWGKIYTEEMRQQVIPVIKSTALNERMYGRLQGLNKKETIEKHGESQVQAWRRSFRIAPPGGESLEMTAKRVIPYFREEILPFLKEGKNILISAHGNSLRSIVMFLDQLTEEEVLHLEIPTGEPFIYDYENENFLKIQ